MPWKPICIFALSLALSAPLCGAQAPQLKQPGQKPSDAPSLPRELSESDTQLILKENNPKSRVDATIRISNGKAAAALRLVGESQYKSAVGEVDLYASLLIYADAFVRKLPESQVKDRNVCLKKIEQAIFKQTRTVDTVMRELPVDYRESVSEKVAEVRKIRIRAINDVLGGGRIMNPSND
ncbi:MAG: hypothetical protein SF339_23805 [Blastocatellia bacterium]|nr:hypothetical protein [Blastocatellia bacterium]